MATLVLSAAGAALGGAMGGGLAGVGAVAGRALGGLLGGALDARLVGGGRTAEAPRATGVRVMGSRPGAAIPMVFGAMRVAGQVIWASRFRERTARSGGGKGGARTISRSYAVSLAVALCEGPVERVGRVWADGRPLAREALTLRLHRGTEDQAPDPLIEATDGWAPAYRGVAYVVIEDLDLGPWGARTPQLSFEVFRQPQADPALSEEIAPPPSALVRAVALSPGSGEASLATEPVRRRLGPGRSVTENVNSTEGRPDALVALDQLQEEAPSCEAAALIVSWFGDDLRCGACTVSPGVEEADKITEPHPWTAGGVGRGEARLLGREGGRPVFGGTPSDRSVVQSIRELRARGLAPMFYPFILMDVPPGSDRPDPYGEGEQAAYPWRGRITLNRAPGLSGSADMTADARAQVSAFFGAAESSDFVIEGETVRYEGPPEWSFRRFILHYAHLCAVAGGVDAFCVGSELRGLTWIRAGLGAYPAVDQLRRLAREVRAILGPGARIGYAADWSEYFGHHATDGSGDVVYHLDPFWAEPDVDFVGIDNYMPLSDWRDGEDHADVAAGSCHALGYLRAGIEGGEGYDWYYASQEDRAAQRRTPITDGAAGEPWVFRYKDIRNWWSRPHHNRIGGVRRPAPTAWRPESKPIWFTEIGCPAIDKGANQPNVFVDPKSSESALPYFSSGARDDAMQRRFLQAALGYWDDAATNPVSSLTGARMIETRRSFVWTWDMRPWPDFPARSDVWSDGANHRLGHWITGRLGAAGLAETVAELCAAAGLAAVDVSDLHGVIAGYALEGARTARQALETLMLAHRFDAVETGDGLRFVHRGAPAVAEIDPAACVAEDGPAMTRSRSPATHAPRGVRLSYVAADGSYEPAAVSAEGGRATFGRVEGFEAPLALDEPAAQTLAARWLREADAAGEEARFTLPPSMARIEPGDALRLPGGAAFRVDRAQEGEGLAVRAKRLPASAADAPAPARAGPPPAAAPRAEPVEVAVVEMLATQGPRAFAFGAPWPGPVAAHRLGADGEVEPLGVIERAATMGELAAPAPPGFSGRWLRDDGWLVRLYGGALRSRTPGAVLAGANRLALRHADGWEAAGFCSAQLEGPGLWRLTGLLRGQAGTEPFAARGVAAGARVVLLDDAGLALTFDAAEAGVAHRLVFGPARLPLGHASETRVDAVATGARLAPLAPAHLRSASDGAGGALIRWVRRTRADGDAWGSVEPPLGEEREAYRVTIERGGAVVRSADVATPAFHYTAAMRTADGAQGAFAVRVAQLSALAGPGAERRTLHVD